MRSIYNKTNRIAHIRRGGNAGMASLPARIYFLYRDGFRSMVVGRTLWKIILLKLFIMFAVLKTFFFPNYLNTQFDTDQARADHVLENLTRSTVDAEDR